MLFVNYCTYILDASKVAAIRPTHREYIARLFEGGKILAAGPFADGTGGLFIYEASDEAEAKKLAGEDPYASTGALASATLELWNPVNVNPKLLVAS